MRRGSDVAVLGAGLAGSVVALELARAGLRVALVEQDAVALNRASLRNEGKIHLGYVYAQDATLETARLMVEGACSFRSIVDRVANGAASRLRHSAPFDYLVARDSLLHPDALAAHYAAVDGLCAGALVDGDYLGLRALPPVRRLAPRESTHVGRGTVAAVFRTAEVALDTVALASALRGALDGEARIDWRPGCRVDRVERQPDSFVVHGGRDGEPWRLRTTQVVNALWDGRLRIVADSGLAPDAGWVHRLKYRAIGRLPARLRGAPSATIVLGRYGDVVVRPDGTVYLSWYPAGLRGWSHDLAPPDDWAAPCRGETDPHTAAEVGRDTAVALDRWLPGIGECEPLVVDAGVIVAYGRSDVDDPASGLHDRTHVGVRSADGFHSLDPGKLTTAPLFAARAVRAVLDAR